MQNNDTCAERNSFEIRTERLRIFPTDYETVGRIDDQTDDGDLTGPSVSRDELLDIMLRDVKAALDFTLMMERLSTESDGEFYSAAVGDEEIGYAAFKRDEAGLQEIQIALLPRWQRRGYGYELLCTLLEAKLADDPGSRFIYRVNHKNRVSIALVEKLGGRLQPAASEIEAVWFKTYLLDLEAFQRRGEKMSLAGRKHCPSKISQGGKCVKKDETQLQYAEEEEEEEEELVEAEFTAVLTALLDYLQHDETERAVAYIKQLLTEEEGEV